MTLFFICLFKYRSLLIQSKSERDLTSPKANGAAPAIKNCPWCYFEMKYIFVFTMSAKKN